MTELGHIYFRVQYELRLFNGSSQNTYEVLNNPFGIKSAKSFKKLFTID